MSISDLKAKAAATRVSVNAEFSTEIIIAADGGDQWERDLWAVLAAVEALPADGVVVSRAMLERWREAVDNANCGVAIIGDGCMADDEKRALYAAESEMDALLKESP